MNFENFFFIFFSSIILTSAIFVIYSSNTIYSIFFLILTFTNATGLLLISEIEFISIMLIIIYVGAITVLFLFIIMMLDINILINKNNFSYFPIILLISFIFSIETFIVFSKNFTTYFNIIEKSFFKNNIIYKQFIKHFDIINNIETIGHILYTYYSFLFLISGIILLIALIGAIFLTKKEKKKNHFLTKKIYKQLSRKSLNAIFNIKNKNDLNLIGRV